MIVVATADFELYHEAVRELRERGLRFTTIEPGDDLPANATVVIATPDDAVEIGGRGDPDDDLGGGEDRDGLEDPDDDDVTFVAADPSDARTAVDAALGALRDGDGRTVVVVDPGPTPGIAVLVGETIVAAFRVPLADAVDVVESEVADATDPLIRVGDGDRLKGARIVSALDDDLTVELVDETGTTPYLGTGARGTSDVLAAVNIARIEGERVDAREIDPTDGEIARIKDESRRRSGGEFTVNDALARRVAGGELTVAEAVAAHRDRDERGEDAEGDDADVPGEDAEGDDGPDDYEFPGDADPL